MRGYSLLGEVVPPPQIVSSQANPVPRVAIRGITDGVLHGWAIYPARPDLAVILEVRIDGRMVGRLLTTPSTALPNEGHAFRLQLPQDSARPASRLTLHPFWGGAPLAECVFKEAPSGMFVWQPGQAAVAVSTSAETLHVEGGVLAQFAGHLIGWARYTAQPELPVLLDVLVNGVMKLAVRTGGGPPVVVPGMGLSGDAGFAVPLEALGPPGAVTIRAAATGVEIWLKDEPVRPTPEHDDTPPPARSGSGSAAPVSVDEVAAAVSAAPDLAQPTILQPTAADAKAEVAYRKWLRVHDAAAPPALQRARTLIESGNAPAPSISVILIAPGGETTASADAVSRSLASLAGQILAAHEILIPANWELALPGNVRAVPATTLDSLIEASAGGLVGMLTAGDTLSPVAMLAMALHSREAPADCWIYSDQDVLGEDEETRLQPYFKGAPDLTLGLAQDYLCRFAVMPAQAARRASGGRPINDLGLCLAVTHHLLRHGPTAFAHLPLILYHRGPRHEPDGSAELILANEVAELLVAAPPEAITLAGAGVPQVSSRAGLRRIRWPLPAPPPLVSVLIPTRDRVDLLRQCVSGVLEETDYPTVEVIIIDNESVNPETLAYFTEAQRDPRVRVVPYAGEFDFAQMNNSAAAMANGPLLLLLNNDIKVIDADWLVEMVRQVLQDSVGAVGARLLYEDGRIQHAGIALGIGGIASHTYKGKPGDTPGHGNRLRAAHEVAAVTAACMLVRREAWDTVGGFTTDFPVAYNDVDLCLKLRKAGWRIVLTPFACLYHLESASRGSDNTPEHQARFEADKLRMQAFWAEELMSDPFLGPNWSLSSTDALPATPPRVSLPW